MAKQRPTRKNDSDVLYLECDLDKAEKANLIEWVKEQRDYFDFIEKCVDSGLRVSLAFDSYHECFMCSLSKPLTTDGKTKTAVLVGRGGNLLQALQAAMYKHTVMLEGDWEDLGRKNARKETDWS